MDYTLVCLVGGAHVPSYVNISLGFQPDTRHAIPGYDGLLYVFAVLLVPTLFSLLIGINILVWSRSRINYVFIFGACSQDTLLPRA